MKRFVVFYLLACAVFAMTALTPVLAYAGTATTYALITGDNCVFLREAAEPSFSNTYFTLPKTYFVNVLKADYSETYHRVRYRDLDGYVKKSDVKIKDYTPVSVFPPDVTLKINIDSDTVYLRSRPDHLSSEVVYKIPSDTARIEYYGQTAGTDGLSTGITTWYYAKMDLGADSTVRGYLYAPYVLLESVIPPDNDTSAAIVPDVDPPINDDPAPQQPTETTDPVRIVGIVALCVPAVAIVIIIFARPRKKSKERAEKFSS